MGKKNFPVYKIVAADARSPRDGKFIESIGVYDPKTHPMTIDIKEDRAFYWLKNGAQPTATVKSLMKRKGVLLKWYLTKKKVSETEIQKKMDEWADVNKNRAERELDKKRRAAERKKKAEKKSEEAAAAQTSA
jgi:small subunit ribosomal protein S16